MTLGIFERPPTPRVPKKCAFVEFLDGRSCVKDSKKISTSVGNMGKMGVSCWSKMAKVQLSFSESDLTSTGSLGRKT